MDIEKIYKEDCLREILKYPFLRGMERTMNEIKGTTSKRFAIIVFTEGSLDKDSSYILLVKLKASLQKYGLSLHTYTLNEVNNKKFEHYFII